MRSLVDRFDSGRSQFISPSYNETQIRRKFIDPFFNALGWDIDNKHGTAEAYRDVVHEDAIKIGSATKAPDYSFRIGGTRKFFVEAKKPAVNIKVDSMVALVEKMLALMPKLRGATLESEKAALQNAVTTTDAEIDRLVYNLYGLTAEEIKIVEGNTDYAAWARNHTTTMRMKNCAQQRYSNS
jgi:hypothetical protein